MSPIEEVYQSEPVLASNELYIPESKPFLAIYKMHRISLVPFSRVEEWQYANRHFVKGGKWPPKKFFCTTSSIPNSLQRELTVLP